MAILITCSKKHVPVYGRMQLEQHEDVIFFPFADKWEQTEKGKALKILMKQRIDRILVTSQEAFDRLYDILTKIDSDDYRKIKYYVLDRETGAYLQNKNLQVVVPTETENVIEHVLEKMKQ